MLLIQEVDKPYQSEKCADCMDDFNILSGYAGYADMCIGCEDGIETIFECPRCETVHKFFGDSAPTYCDGCKTLLPDIINLKVSPTKRIRYHKTNENISNI